MSDCKQKFLGLNNIGDLLEAFEKKIEYNIGDSKLFTLQLFKYVADGDNVDSPNNGIYYNFNTSSIVFPSEDLSWNTLAAVVRALDENDLSNGSIYTSVRIQQGNSGATEQQPWSTPIKISGINGTNGLSGAEFIFSYTIDGDYSSDVLKLLDEDGKREIYYQYRPSNNAEWSSPMIWAKYTTDGQDGLNAIYYEHQYAITSVDDVAADDSLIPPSNDAIWYNNVLPANLTNKFPYLWKRSRKVTIDGTESWSEPALISRFGQDGTAPEYNMTLYKWSEGYLKPEQPTLGEFDEETGKYEFIKFDDFRANNPDWLDVPTLNAATPVAIDVENTVEVSTEEDITNNLVDGKIIKLTEDIKLLKPLIITEGNITIDLNGHTITCGLFGESNGEVIDGWTDSYVFWVKGGHLTIQGNGKVIAIPANYSMAVWSNGGDVTINGGYYENGGESCDLIYGSARIVDGVRRGGTIKIYGGEFYATLIGEEAGTGNKRSALNTKNADMDICFIEVYGGYFHEFDPSNNLSLPGSTGNFLGEGVKLINNNGVFEVVNSLLPNIWWQCTIKINGSKEEIMQIGTVERYTAIDGAALPGEYTKFMYKWFENQTLPEDFEFNIEDWNDTPDKNVITTPDASLWMVSTTVNGIDSEGKPNVQEWSSPVKLSGPRGPISYDYRTETLYKRGNLSNPANGEWTKDIPKTNTTYPYIWAREMLSCYTMKYKDTPNADGTYDIVVDESIKPKEIEVYGEFRMTGIDGKDGVDGKDGNSSNNVSYSKTTDPVIIDKYYDKNYFISNVDGEIIYNFELVSAAFEEGATFKFANIKGTSKFITKELMPFIFKGESVTEFTCSQYDCFEIVCVKDVDKQVLIVIGGKF